MHTPRRDEPPPVILAVCGPPGSGKTTIATRVHDQLSGSYRDAPDSPQNCDSDTDREIRLLHSDDFSRRPYEQMHDVVTASDAHFILDGTFYKPEHQRPFLELPDTHFVVIRAALDTCLRRDHERDGIGQKAVRVIHSEFHDPPADFVLDTDVLPVEDAVRLLTDRAREWLD